ncbi:hypothetical protein PRNP1_010345 [Phytophthora ramorum]
MSDDVCRRGPPGERPEEVLMETTTLDEAMGAIVDWPKQFKFDSLGIALVGPVDQNMVSPTYDFITNTSKPN